MSTVMDKWAEQNNKLLAREIDWNELQAYRATGLNPTQVRALHNQLTIMRTFVEAVDSDEYTLTPVKSKEQERDEFWENSEAWDK